MRYLGIDYGLTHVGLALGDDESYLATIYDFFDETDLDKQVANIEEIVIQESIDEVVVGYPLTLQGGKSKQTAMTIDFIDKLSGTISIPVNREDERLTSQQSKKLLLETGTNTNEHALAAATLLQTFLDRKRMYT